MAFDPIPAITTGVEAVRDQTFSIIAVVAPIAIAILGGIIAIRKGMSVFRRLIGS